MSAVDLQFRTALHWAAVLGMYIIIYVCIYDVCIICMDVCNMPVRMYICVYACICIDVGTYVCMYDIVCMFV